MGTVCRTQLKSIAALDSKISVHLGPFITSKRGQSKAKLLIVPATANIIELTAGPSVPLEFLLHIEREWGAQLLQVSK